MPFSLFDGRAGKPGTMVYSPDNGAGTSGGNASQPGTTQPQPAGQGTPAKAEGTGERTFTQAEVDRIIQDRIARAKASRDDEWNKRVDGLSADEIEELKALKANKKKADEEELIAKKRYDEHLTKLQTTFQKEKSALERENKEIMNRYHKTLIDTAIFGTLGKFKVVERAAGQIASLLRGHFRVKNPETGEVEVVGSDGGFLPDSRGIPHTPETFLAQWLDENPHFVSGSGGGSGYVGSLGGKPVFTREQVADPKFYQKNREAILQAQKEGRIKK